MKSGLYCAEVKTDTEAFSKDDTIKVCTTPTDSFLSHNTRLDLFQEIKLLHLRHGHLPFDRLKFLYPELKISNV